MSEKSCSVDGCDRSYYAKGWCQMHYMRVLRLGEPGPAQPIESPNYDGRAEYVQQTATCVCGQEFPLRRSGSPKRFCSTRCRARWYSQQRREAGYQRPLTGPCSVEQCALPEQALGLCPKHYTRLRKYGDVDFTKYDVRPGEWRLTSDGYVYRNINGRREHQHRVVMEELLGRPLYPEENVHHKNGQRSDNRPENLELWVVPQPTGQRVTELVAWVVDHYPEQVRAALKEQAIA